MSSDDVIFALASGQGRAGVAIIRVSGPGAAKLFPALTGGPPSPPRRASLRRLVDPEGAGVLDEALTLWFPGPASFTGEDVVELHLHGGSAVVAGVADALGQLVGFRPAEPGEFTRRAFRAGRLDLAEAEGLGDLIEADTAAARRQAIWQMQGGLSALYAGWRERLAHVLAFAEASLDFADEPLPPDIEAANAANIIALRETLSGYLSGPRPTERMRDGMYVALIGPPNVGKSSLLNALAGRDAAIVTDTPGTTRDVLEVRLDLGGYPVTIADTAGLRESSNAIEQEGMRRARAAATNADVVIQVADSREWPVAARLSPNEDPPSAIFWNKSDIRAAPIGEETLAGSATTGAGLDQLEGYLLDRAATLIETGPLPAITRARHRVALEDCVAALDRWQIAPAPELAAEDLRLAARALGRIAGVIDVEDLLDRIFGAFCIGK